MKTYSEASFEIEIFESEDIIVSSTCPNETASVDPWN